jgi:hypothetical protein
MGGKGETVSYKRIVAKSKDDRAALKEEINAIIDECSTAISVIVLVDEEPT